MSLSETRFGGNAPGLPGLTPLPPISAALSRRAALFGAVTVVACAPVAANAAAPPSRAATASASPPMSPEAAVLQEEAARLSREYHLASREADAACDRIDYPDPPKALYAQIRDYRLFARNPVPSWSDAAEGRYWWAEPEIIEGLRGSSLRYLSRHDCPEACARRDEIVAAFDGWKAADKAAENAAGYTAAMDRFKAADAAYRSFRQRLVDLRTEDPEVLTVKALVIADLCGRDQARLDRLVARVEARDGGSTEAALALSMARDFIGLFGASAWVSA